MDSVNSVAVMLVGGPFPDVVRRESPMTVDLAVQRLYQGNDQSGQTVYQTPPTLVDSRGLLCGGPGYGASP